MGIQRWIILTSYDYGHHAAYVGKHNLVLFQKVITLQSASFLHRHGADISYTGFRRHPVILLSRRSLDQDFPSVSLLSHIRSRETLSLCTYGNWFHCLGLLGRLHYPGLCRLHSIRK